MYLDIIYIYTYTLYIYIHTPHLSSQSLAIYCQLGDYMIAPSTFHQTYPPSSRISRRLLAEPWRSLILSVYFSRRRSLIPIVDNSFCFTCLESIGEEEASKALDMNRLFWCDMIWYSTYMIITLHCMVLIPLISQCCCFRDSNHKPDPTQGLELASTHWHFQLWWWKATRRSEKDPFFGPFSRNCPIGKGDLLRMCPWALSDAPDEAEAAAVWDAQGLETFMLLHWPHRVVLKAN